MATSYNNIGSTYKAQGNYDKALEYFLYAAKHIVLRGDRPAMAFAYNDIGNVYKDQGNYEKALEYFFNALKLFEDADSKQGIAATLTHLGSIYKDQRDYEKALEYFTQSLSIKTKLGDKRGIANSLRDLGLVYEEQKNTGKALEYLERALAMREEIGDRYGMTLDCIGIADIHVRNGAPKLALPFLQRSNALTKEIKSKELITGLEAKFAEYYNAIGEPRNALQHAASSMELAQVVRKVEYARNAAEQLYLASAALGQYQEAFKNHQLFISLRDSIENARNHRASLSREFAFKEEKARIEQQKKLLEVSASRERQKRIAWSLGGIAITIALMLVLVFRSNMQKKRVNRELLEQKHETEVAKEELEKLNGIKNRLLSIISHDVRGPLNSLKALLHLFDNRALTQQEFHDVVANLGHQVGQVNSLLDNLLRWTKNQLDQVKPELKTLALRPLVDEVIGLHALSAKSKHITMHCEVPDALHIYADEEMMKIVVRNLVSNAVKFCEANDVIHIRASEKTANSSGPNAGMARISVEDTGRGISAENLKMLFGVAHLSTKGTNEEIGTGLGLSLCREFVEKCGGQIDVASEEGKGTRFEFTVPLSRAS
jgi:signal transduction histidine kinase